MTASSRGVAAVFLSPRFLLCIIYQKPIKILKLITQNSGILHFDKRTESNLCFEGRFFLAFSHQSRPLIIYISHLCLTICGVL